MALFEGYTTDIGLDLTKFRADLTSADVQRRIDEHVELGNSSNTARADIRMSMCQMCVCSTKSKKYQE
jgi:hypothetical protein